MKTALVKQKYDVFGPWSGVLWKDTSPERILDVWPGKALYWQLTCLLEADWYVIPQSLENHFIRDAVRSKEGRAEIIEKHVKNITPVSEIPFSEYNLVITMDPILTPPAGLETVFAYHVQEHWDPIYGQSLIKPSAGYDLFLAHMMDAPSDLGRIPQAISFPYVHDTNSVRKWFGGTKQEIVWMDWRVSMTLANRGLGDSWSREVDAALERLTSVVNMEVRCRSASHAISYAISPTLAWRDAADYYRKLAECRYYVAVGQLAGAGEGMADAVAAGCVCIGQADRAYHRMLCHPSCLCLDMVEMPKRLRVVAGSRELQEEILQYQDQAMERLFVQRPVRLLERARELKAALGRRGRPGSAMATGETRAKRVVR